MENEAQGRDVSAIRADLSALIQDLKELEGLLDAANKKGCDAFNAATSAEDRAKKWQWAMDTAAFSGKVSNIRASVEAIERGDGYRTPSDVADW